MKRIQIASVDVTAGTCTTDAGEACRITDLYDLNGDKVTDPFVATACIAEHPSGTLLAIDLRPFMSRTAH